jgi:hypothetical protein
VPRTDFQKSFARFGHGHAGALVILSLVALRAALVSRDAAEGPRLALIAAGVAGLDLADS